jgi:hypothetical protein
MKVDITYTNEATNRKRTLKNVTYLGRAHARAISEAREGTINFPLPVGFRLAATATGNPVLRPEDRRKIAKTLRQNKKNLMEEVTGLHKFFDSPIDIYSVRQRSHPRARVIDFEGTPAVEYFLGRSISGRMNDLKSFLRTCSAIDTVFDGQPAYAIKPNNVDNLLGWLLSNARYDSNQATYDFIRAALETDPDLLFILFKSKIRRNLPTLSHGVQPEFQNAADIPVGRGQPLLSSRFIRYDIVPSDTFTGMFNLPPKADNDSNTCLYDAVWDMLERDSLWQGTHKEVWGAIKEDPQRFMWSINRPTEEYPGAGKLPLATLREFYPMFDLLRKDLRVFDMRHKIWMSRHPYKCTYRKGVMTYVTDEDCDRVETRPDNNSRCKCLSFIIHSNHVYLLNRPYVVASKDDLEAEHYYQPETRDDKRTTDYVLPREQDTELSDEDKLDSGYFPHEPIVVCSDPTRTWYDEVARYVSQTERTHYTFYTGGDMLQAGMELFLRTGYEPGFVAEGRDLVHGLNICNFWRGGLQLSVSIRPFPCHMKRHVCPYTPEASTLLKSYMEESLRLRCQLLTHATMSEYSDKTRRLLRHYKMGGINDFYGEVAMPGFEALGLDFNKFYPWVMCQWEEVPVFSVFDRPMRYDGHALEPYTFYEVLQREPSRAYSKRMFHMAYGSTLLRLPSDHPRYEIVSFIRPSKIMSCDYVEHVKALLSNSDLDIRVLKTLFATMSGVLGISQYKRHGSKLLFNLEEAGHYMALMGDRSLIQSRELERIGKVFLVSEDRTQELHSGFDPLYMRVIDEAMLEVHLLENKLRGLGYPVLGRRIDNVYLNIPAEDEHAKECLRRDLGGLIQTDQTGFEAFGLLKFESKKLPDHGIPKKVDIVNNRYHHRCELAVPTTHEVNEWDEESVFQKLDELRAERKHVQLLADCPGSGKTTALVRYAKSRGLSVVLVSFMNKTVFLRKEDFNGYEKATLSTISHLSESKNLGVLKEADMVIVDEWATTPIKVLTPIKRMMSDIKWLAVTSDVHQNPAINKGFNNIHDVHEYYTRLTNDICLDVIRLKEPKRSRCPCHQKVYTLPEIRDCPECLNLREKTKSIVRGILDAPTERHAVSFVLDQFRRVQCLKDLSDDTMAITYYQLTRAKLNRHFHDRVSRVPYYEGQTLVCRERYFKTIEKVRHSVHVNYEVVVKDVCAGTVTLLEPLTEWEFKMSEAEVGKHFLYAHASTCHAMQGATHDGPVAVFDIWGPDVTRNWLLVAVTRNIDLENTVIYTGTEMRGLEVSLRHQIERMIQSHKDADRKAGRVYAPKNYITPEDVMQLLATVRVCPVCGTDDIGTESFSIDRIDSELPHVKGNCSLLCSARCNSSKKRRIVPA